MAMVRHIVDTDNPPPLSEESLAELAALSELKDEQIDCSDIPPSTPEQLQRMQEMAEGKRERHAFTKKLQKKLEKKLQKKQMFSLRLQSSTIEWWKENVGSGYTTVMGRLLEKAKNHPEWINACL